MPYLLKENGYTNVVFVKEQYAPDGMFSTCPYPNPENAEALALGLAYARKTKADLLLATDPDADRLGVAVKNNKGDYALLSGNEVGVLLLDYICSQKIKTNTMPRHALLIKTIVSSAMAEKIAENYGVKTINVLTGFKFIGEQISLLEAQGRVGDFLFGFEESCGYLSGDYVRDKDGVGATFLLCEMCAFYQAKGITLFNKLRELYQAFGYHLNTLHTYAFEGVRGFAEMQEMMWRLRLQEGASLLGRRKVKQIKDYSLGIDGLPKSDVLHFLLEDGSSFIIRPSGTEPKLKLYVSVVAKNKKEASLQERALLSKITFFLGVEFEANAPKSKMLFQEKAKRKPKEKCPKSAKQGENYAEKTQKQSFFLR